MQSELYIKEALQHANVEKHQERGELTWQSPSNIAIVKYWGKKPIQIPCNPNLSFTLSASYTTTTLKYQLREDKGDHISLDFFFENKANSAFADRIKKYLTALLPYFPFLNLYHLAVHSSNSFPHSSGIASSASAMSALTLCICSMEAEILGLDQTKEKFLKKASFISRLGSGSACRSVYPKAALWGRTDQYADSSDEFAVGVSHILHPNFQHLRDTIVIVSDEVKSVSSSAGHNLMKGNPYASIRYQVANQRLTRLLDILQAGDWQAFGEMAEQEALDLHALMMSSSPSYILMKPKTISLIHKIRSIREDTQLPMYFTLDAGPNIHLLYPNEVASEVEQVIKVQILPSMVDVQIIYDGLGEGARRL